MFPTFITRIINFCMDGVNMFIQTPLFCEKFVALRTVLDPLWKRLKCSFWLFFLFEIFSTWSQDCNLSEKSLSQNDIANSSNVLVWLVTRSDLVSHHSSTHKQAGNISREWVISSCVAMDFCLPLNISAIIAREV